MESIPNIGALSSFLATLLGVLIAFQLDRYAENKQEKKTTIEQLKTVKSELNDNEDLLAGNYRVINELQKEGNPASHYALRLCSTSAWRSTLDENVIDNIDAELYHDIQSIYMEIESVNELVKRLRTESLHPELGETEGVLESSVWTISVTHWNSDSGRVEETGLGDLIKNRSNQTKVAIDGVDGKIDEQISHLEDRTTIIARLKSLCS